MRKRQRKKNQKKFLRWFQKYLKELAPLIERCNRRLEQHCRWHGHQYRDNRYVGIPDFDGYVCMCCGEKIPRQAVEKMSKEGQNAAQAGKAWQKTLTLHIKTQSDVNIKEKLEAYKNYIG